MAVNPPLERSVHVPEAAKKNIRLDYLDSLRALAAVYVLLYHAFWFTINTSIFGYPKIVRLVFAFFMYGHDAVDLFIVLSGYCLMLPVVRSIDQNISYGLAGFFKRRARRILPPYYAAIVVSVAVNEILEHFHRARFSNESFTTAGLIAHLFLVHDFSAKLSTQVNTVMWSVAVEWQIYFLFALALLPLWKKLGSAWTVLIALAITCPLSLLHNEWSATVQDASPWYLALFGMGMAAAAVNFGRDAHYLALRTRVNWRWFGIALVVLFIGLLPVFRAQTNRCVDDVLAGALCSAFLAYVTNSIITGERKTWLVNALEWRPLVVVGTFSYSLYLIHLPVLDLLRAFTPHAFFRPATILGVVIPVSVTLAVLVAYGFYQLVERRFQNIASIHVR